VYLTWVNPVFLAFFAFNGTSNLRAFNVAFSSIPTAPPNISFPDNSSETSPVRTITVSTRADSDSENVKISVEDTGLSFAIAAPIVAERGGTLHVQDNFPADSRFLITLPAADVPVAVPH